MSVGGRLSTCGQEWAASGVRIDDLGVTPLVVVCGVVSAPSEDDSRQAVMRRREATIRPVTTMANAHNPRSDVFRPAAGKASSLSSADT